jgi:lipopolysaccharide transport system permease protein
MIPNIKTKISSYLALGWIEVQLKYTRSLLGPFWITLSACILIGGMTIVNLSLFGLNIEEVMPWIAVGIIMWNYIVVIIEESLGIFDDQKILNIRIEPVDIIAIQICKNLIILLHNLIILVPIIFIFDLPITKNYFYLLYGFTIFLINSFSFTTIFGILCLRYRDFVLIIRNLLFLLFLMTPIFWVPVNLNNNRIAFVDYNILFQIIQTVRDPLLGNPINNFCFLITSIFTLVFLFISIIVYKKFKTRIVFWI